MRVLSVLYLVVLCILVASCGSIGQITQPTALPTTSAPVTITVFAAASLSDAFKELSTQFRTVHSEVELNFNFAGSDQLAQQIVQGAPADIFASANTKQMDVVIQAAEAQSGSQKVFVRNRLVLVYPKENPAHLQSLADLARPGVKLVLANKSVPVGAYALDFLTKASQLPAYSATYSPSVLSNVVSYEESVRAVLSKVSLGEADAGIVYTTDAASVSDGSIGTLEIPDALNTLASYPIAVTKQGQSKSQAHAFVEYVLSPEGQQILQKYGFISGN